MKILLISTGTELSEPGEKRARYGIYNSSYYSLSGYLRMMGFTVERGGDVPDNQDLISSRIQEGLNGDADLVITTGGASVGDYDFAVRAAEALGMEILALDPFLTPEQIEAGGAKPVFNLEELYSSSDYVSIHIPALPSTIKSIGYDLVTKMPKGATLVNTARKEVIDEEGLMKALEERPDLKYVTDVMPDNYEALREKFGLRVFATPKKMGAQTAEANMNAGLAAARQIVDFFATGNTRFQVNK